MDDRTLLNKKVYLVIALQGFQDEAYRLVKNGLEENGAEVLTVALDIGAAKGVAGESIETDLSVSEMDVTSCDAIVFIGGPGVSAYFTDETTLEAVKEAYEKGKVLGAICEAPMILANAGVLRAKHVTAFSSLSAKLKELGADVVTESVEVDGKIITAKDTKYAREFTEKLSQLLIEFN